MKIVVLEQIDITLEQKTRLARLGSVTYHTNSTDEEAAIRIKDADVVVLNWVDPSNFVLSMKSPSLVSLLSTGYSWINNRETARNKGVVISNIPNYATEAVAEHNIGLILSVSKKIGLGDRSIRSGMSNRGGLQGFELRNKKIGIIGLGNIGYRVAELAKCFGMEVVSFNRTRRNVPWINFVSLENLLSMSDVICITCSLNNESKGMLGIKQLSLIKNKPIIVGTTWDILVLEDIIPLLKNGKISGLAFDAAFEGKDIELANELIELDNVTLTPHIAYDTKESTIRQIDICISNIEAFCQGKEQNVVN